MKLNAPGAEFWRRLGPDLLPFADAASADLPLARLLRLSLFQVSVGLALVLLNGTLNRVMIVELGVPAWLVATVIGLPVLFAPVRALIGHRSDQHRSYLGWRRLPYIWGGTLLQFGGFAIMPFALLVLTDQTVGPAWAGSVATAVAFLMVGAGMHATQTAGLALATDIAPQSSRPRVIALLYVMMLVGMLASAAILGSLLDNYSPMRLIQVIQGAALFTMVANFVATWKQEVRNPDRTRHDLPTVSFGTAWQTFTADSGARRLLVAVALGTLAFSMQDILLEPYGAEVLGLAVGETTRLTAVMAFGTLLAFVVAARFLQNGGNEYRLAGGSILIGLVAFSCVIFSAPMGSIVLLVLGTLFIGAGAGLFTLAMLFAVMHKAREDQHGLALGLWGAVQATALGGGLALGGVLRDLVAAMGQQGLLGDVLSQPYVGYSVVYHCEILMLFATAVALGPLVREAGSKALADKFGIVEFPG
ncbi:MAG: BCD family MFS transporter [Pseudomonadales bacterium]